jgi:hypothetical protein
MVSMRSAFVERHTRREFFRGTARWALLGTIAALSAVQLRKSAQQQHRCERKGICAGCAVFSTCGLPAALSAKEGGRIS